MRYFTVIVLSGSKHQHIPPRPPPVIIEQQQNDHHVTPRHAEDQETSTHYLRLNPQGEHTVTSTRHHSYCGTGVCDTLLHQPLHEDTTVVA